MSLKLLRNSGGPTAGRGTKGSWRGASSTTSHPREGAPGRAPSLVHQQLSWRSQEEWPPTCGIKLGNYHHLWSRNHHETTTAVAVAAKLSCFAFIGAIDHSFSHLGGIPILVATKWCAWSQCAIANSVGHQLRIAGAHGTTDGQVRNGLQKNISAGLVTLNQMISEVTIDLQQ